MTVIVATNWSALGKLGVIDYILNDPHQYTLEDIEWAKEHMGMDREAIRSRFVTLKKLAYVDAGMVLSPVYLFGVDQFNQIQTLSHASLERKKIHMTKSVLRFMATDEGKEFFAGAIGIAERSDATPQRLAWIAKLGFAKYAENDYAGQTFQYFHKGA
jgi:hypothetical protein